MREIEAIDQLVQLYVVEPGYIIPEHVSALKRLEALDRYCSTGCYLYQKSLVDEYFVYLHNIMGENEKALTYVDRLLDNSSIQGVKRLEKQMTGAQLSYKLDDYVKMESYLEGVSLEKLPQHYKGSFMLYSIVLQWQFGQVDEAISELNALSKRVSKGVSNSKSLVSLYELEEKILKSQGRNDLVEGVQKKIEEIKSDRAKDEYLPVLKVAPRYPEEAAKASIEGYCTVSYTVLKTGKTTDHQIVECSNEIFRSESLRVAKKFLYKPRIENGQPVDVRDVKNRFTYEIAN
ncbi:energy transducer TonB [Teredinibacter sp. KSP-S5-2]|uniref:energy transducer TonB n=1 Tax=Teredinibacter sp. KSP-S5-2 TaxID=3034506 RepID=UPI0029347BF7|nr:energy transducer TonB [Teredinibacter sp. KSP-S5-2]WNO09608.1 energy transducer TonB [Teredinibacter sp. KSP-S5-2]